MASNESISLLNNFWPKITNDVELMSSTEFASKNPELPLARIKKIMKLDEEVKMISAEAPIIFAKAAELFIQEVTIRSWIHTEENKRRTLQKNDVTLAISKYDEFDFLIDIVPREEKKPSTKKESTSPNASYVANQTTTNTPVNNNVLTGITDQSAQNLLNVLNCNTINTSQNGVVFNQVPQTNPTNENVQYYFTMPDQSTVTTVGQQQIQGLPNNINLSNLQGLQNLQGINGLQNAQIVLNANGQPTIFVGNRDDC